MTPEHRPGSGARNAFPEPGARSREGGAPDPAGSSEVTPGGGEPVRWVPPSRRFRALPGDCTGQITGWWVPAQPGLAGVGKSRGRKGGSSGSCLRCWGLPLGAQSPGSGGGWKEGQPERAQCALPPAPLGPSAPGKRPLRPRKSPAWSGGSPSEASPGVVPALPLRGMFRPRSTQSGLAPGPPESQAEEPWEQEMERLRVSRAPVQTLPYAMVDRRLIRKLREPEGVKASCWQRRRQRARQRLREAARRLAQGFGLWEGALYEIGGLFGTGIQSYFTFLRFLLLLNLLTLLLTASFVLLPLAWLRPHDPGPALNLSLQCSSSQQPQSGIPRFHNPLWNVLTGRAFNNTYLFYGGYRAGPERSSAYSIRLAYLLSPLACLFLSFCGTLRRMVKGLPQKLLLGQGYRTSLSAKVFSSWDFCIRVHEAATIKKHEIRNELKMELEEGLRLELAQQRTPAQRACHLLTYLPVNVLIALLVVGAISAIFWATKYSQDNKEESLFLLLQYLPSGVIALVNFLGPQLFVVLIQLEKYPPSTEVNLTLIWCVVLKLASLGMFSFSLGQTILCIGRNKTSCESYGYNACDYQCWENAVGEEFYKLIIFNFLLTMAFAFLVTLPRRLLVERFTGWFWTWLGREEFLVPKNVLDIVAAQTVTWMGLFYCPLLPLLNSIFIFITFYIKKYTLLRNSRSSRRLFRASNSTFFFQLVLLLGLLLAAVPLGYVVSSTHSSWDCGLYTNYSSPWQVVSERVALPGQRALHYLGSHAFSLPLLFLLSLVLTVCVSQSRANARAIRGLQKQLVWQVQEKWHLVEDLSRLLPELSPGESLGPESLPSRASRPRSFCPGFPCPGSPGPRTPRPGSSDVDLSRLNPSNPGPSGASVPAPRFRFPSSSEL